jgi:hypothetical protein
LIQQKLSRYGGSTHVQVYFTITIKQWLRLQFLFWIVIIMFVIYVLLKANLISTRAKKIVYLQHQSKLRQSLTINDSCLILEYLFNLKSFKMPVHRPKLLQPTLDVGWSAWSFTINFLNILRPTEHELGHFLTLRMFLNFR